tara:strand:- start:202 stop:423 length:222 start_codon:yes stop_codon:yes gene_type:complete
MARTRSALASVRRGGLAAAAGLGSPAVFERADRSLDLIALSPGCTGRAPDAHRGYERFCAALFDLNMRQAGNK